MKSKDKIGESDTLRNLRKRSALIHYQVFIDTLVTAPVEKTAKQVNINLFTPPREDRTWFPQQ